MIDYSALCKHGEKAGFTHVVVLDAATIELRQEVRDMCASNKCGKYNDNWACPPGCGTLEECLERVSKYKKGIIVQTVAELEDALDGEGMMDANELHQKNFIAFTEELYEAYGKLLPLGSGCCSRCEACTYPDAPCRFPDMATSSMEAYGMVVSQVCQANQLPYYYGPCTITYTSCYLLE